MELNISNPSVYERIESCLDEFHKIRCIIDGMGSMSHPVPYLTRYAIIRACGAIEYGFKTIISDANTHGQPEQIKNFINKKFRHSSMNPSLTNIISSLKGFDEQWACNFKQILDGYEHNQKIKSSLKSLTDARNAFAHGGAPSTSFSSIENYFEDCVKVLESIELAISE